jgi:hypothetical protein
MVFGYADALERVGVGPGAHLECRGIDFGARGPELPWMAQIEVQYFH